MNLLQTIRSLAPLLASVAQAEYDAWEVDAGGMDPEIGEGGICDRVADAMGTVLAQHGIDVTEGGQDGDDHAFLYAYNETEAVEVDIPPGVYETGSGYSWKKRLGVTIGADDVMINPVRREDILGESVDSTGFNIERVFLNRIGPMELYVVRDPEFTGSKIDMGMADQHNIIGFVRLILWNKGQVDVDKIWTHPDYRRRGIGTALMNRVRADHHNIALPIVTRMGAPFFRSLGMVSEALTPTQFMQMVEANC